MNSPFPTSNTGEDDPSFRPADQIEQALPGIKAEENAIAAGASSNTTDANATNFEFSRDQNEIIDGLASSMKSVGVVSVLGGGFLLVVGAVLLAHGELATPIQGVVAIIVGCFMVHAAGTFRHIADSPGNDIGQLMTALSTLRSLYQMQVFLLLVALGILIAAFCLRAG